MLHAARLERAWHHLRAQDLHDFFAERKSCPDELGLLLLDFLVARFVPAGAVVRLAADDSLFGRSGKQVYGAARQYDNSQSSGQGPKIGCGNNWVILTLIVRLPFMARAVSVPLHKLLWQPDPQAKAKGTGKRKPDLDYPSKPQLARKMLDLVVARLAGRRIDSAYATKAMRDLPERTCVTSRLKSNAALYAPKPPRTGKRGQPARKAQGYPS